MTRTAYDREHERDLARHDWRPGDRLPLAQMAAIAKLVGYSEAIAEAGLIGDEMECKLRAVIAETLVAFNMPSKAETEHA